MKQLILFFVLAPLCAFGQGVRWDLGAPGSAGVTTVAGGGLVGAPPSGSLLATPNIWTASNVFSRGAAFGNMTVAQMLALSSPILGTHITVIDPASVSDCTVGGGNGISFPPHECYWNGVSWSAVGSGTSLCGSVVGILYSNGTLVQCDPNATLDGFGNITLHSATFNGSGASQIQMGDNTSLGLTGASGTMTFGSVSGCPSWLEASTKVFGVCNTPANGTLLQGDANGNITNSSVSASSVANALSSSAASTAINQLCESTGSGVRTCNWKDGRDVKIIPLCMSPGGVASAGVSYAAGQWTPTNRAGTNNIGCYLAASPNTGASLQFLIELPADWDSAVQPWISIVFNGGDGTHTVVWTVSEAPSALSGSGLDDPTFTADTAISGTPSGGNFFENVTEQMAHAGSTRPAMLIVKLALSGTYTGTVGAYEAIVTIPTLPVAQAN